MIIVLVKYNCKEGNRDSFLGAIKERGIDVLCQKENGNIKYEYSFSTEDSDVLFLTEIWENIDVLNAHWQTEHFKTLGELKDTYVDSTEIQKFEAESL